MTINEPLSEREEGNTNVALLTPDNFYVFKKDGSGPFALASKGNAASEQGTIISNCPVATVPYSIGPYTADKYLFNYKKAAGSNAHYYIDGYREKNENKDVIVDITAKTELNGLVFPVEFSFYKNRYWAVCRTKEDLLITPGGQSAPDMAKPKHSKVTKMEYEGDSNGMPLIKRVTISLFSPDNKEISRTVYGVEKIIPGPPELKLFDPKQFLPQDFPAKSTLEGSKLTWGRIVLILTGVLLIIIGIGLSLRSKNRTA